MENVSQRDEGLLFKVRRQSDGHEFKIYTDGRIEGFGDAHLVFNYYPGQVAQELVRLKERLTGVSVPDK